MIFEDSTGKRWRLAITAFWMFAVLSTVGMAVLSLSAMVSPGLPEDHPLHNHAQKSGEHSLFAFRKVIAANVESESSNEKSIQQAKTSTEMYRLRKNPEESSAVEYIFEQVGQDFPEKSLLLTFDDGPHPDWTPQILDILDTYKIKAAFFVTGKQALRYPELLRTIADKGHLIGNHTYSHPNIFHISTLRLTSEINMTERAIVDAIGKRTVVFRSPYFIQTKITDTSKFPALEHISSMGYTIAGANIDSRDWEAHSADDLLKNIRGEMGNPGSHVILLHDAGANRAITIEALEKFIPEAMTEGYAFMGMDEAMGIPLSVLMPETSPVETQFSHLSSITTKTADIAWAVIKWLFFVTTAIATARVVFIGSMVVYSLFRREKWRSMPTEAEQHVTVIIPAFNEEKTIERTVQAVLQSDHQLLSVVVVDDGSTDNTVYIARQLQAMDPRVTVVQKDNGGKSSALNRGFIEAESEIIITIDADTLVEKQTISALIRPFSDPTITAACGNVEVGNVQNIVTGFQALEYITTQNFDRRAFDALNCISVVPGATSAWRKSAVLQAGGFTSDTLAEDSDLTLTLLREGGKIVYVPEARALTEAPLNVRCLARQRFRWVYGTLQCLKKHFGAFFQGTLGWFALPNILLFHILFPLLAPIGDIALLFSLLQQEVSDMIVWYFLFMYIDLFGSLLAFTLERRPRKMMALIVIQRFCYRQFMYVVLFKSIAAALRGQPCSWNRVKRTGTVLTTA